MCVVVHLATLPACVGAEASAGALVRIRKLADAHQLVSRFNEVLGCRCRLRDSPSTSAISWTVAHL